MLGSDLFAIAAICVISSLSTYLGLHVALSTPKPSKSQSEEAAIAKPGAAFPF